MQRLLGEVEAVLEGEEYGEAVRYVCAVPESALGHFRRAVADLTRGAGTVREL